MGRDIVETVHHDHATGTRHVLRLDRRSSRDVLADMAREEAHVKVVSGTNAVPDEHSHLLF